MKLTITLILSLFLSFSYAQKSVFVKKIDNSVQIDGILDEAFWKDVQPAGDFWQYFPTDSAQAKAQTEIYMTYDEQNLYVGIKCYASGNDWIVNSLRRDFRAGGNDNITLIFDTFDDRTNAFFFGVNPFGVIREGVITNGGNSGDDFSEAWDNKWRGNAHIFDGYYTAELEIPFSTLRFKAENDTWGFHAYRFDTQDNEVSVWNRVPRNQTLFGVAFAGEMKWEEPLGKSKSTVSVIPFVSSNYNKDYEDNIPHNIDYDFGGDMKIGISSGLNLDLTINPDFAQVEVDQQVTNIDRFEIFFPERRQFFLENADLFGSFGFESTNPFFSRRIGVAIDTSTDVAIQNRILGGARLSGKVNNDLRVGLLTMQTAADEQSAMPSFNYTVAAAQHKVFNRSNIGFIFANKQALEEPTIEDVNKYNRVIGLDFNYANQDNTWAGKTYFHSSLSPETSGLRYAHGTYLNYSKRAFGFEWDHEYVQDGYNAEIGFVRRTDFFRINPYAELRFYPVNKSFVEIKYGLGTRLFTRPGLGRTDQDWIFRVEGEMSNSARLNVSLVNSYIYLTEEFDPTGTDSDPLAPDTDYHFTALRASYNSDRRKDVNFSVRPYIGQYFNGMRYGMSGSLNLRFQPKSIVGINYSYNYFTQDHLSGSRENFLIGPRVDYTFSRDLFLTLFVQYNSQSDNMNINGRLQWRFAPVSDFFLVYTDNYATNNLDDLSDRFALNIRNRALVAKLTYWLNI